MNFLKVLREKRGLTKYGMAKLLGMIPNSYYHFEDKAQGASLESLVTIKRKLNLSWDALGKLIEKEVDDQAADR